MIKSGTILNNYIYQIGSEEILIDSDIVNSNPDIFNPVDWKQELHSYIKSNKFPQPKTLASKLEPFIEEMIISSGNNNDIKIDSERLSEIETKESELNNREKKIKYKEEEIEIRLKRVEKRENEYKEDLKKLDSKEDELRNKSSELTERELDIQDKIQDINERERNLDRNLLESSKDIDNKYTELKGKIDKDLKFLTEKEKDLESQYKSIKNREDKLLQRESEIEDLIRDLKLQKEDFELYTQEIQKMDSEIKEWEKLHWKFKRSRKPPSCI